MTEETTPSGKEWYKTRWGILILLIAFPFSLTYWIWKRSWAVREKLIVTGALWIFVIVLISLVKPEEIENKDSYKEGFKAGLEAAKKNTPSPIANQVVNNVISVSPSLNPPPSSSPSPSSNVTPSSSITPTPKASIKPSPTPTPKPVYNEQLGNNWIAAKYAQDIMNTANKAVPGFVTSSYLELSPTDTGDKDEDSYKKSVISAYLTVRVNNSMWGSFDDSSKKDVTATLVVSVGNIFPGGFPHIYVNNGVRTVAEGEYNFWKTEPKITLK